jgi:isopropylmalate/homocitrate/citramalate synthase
MSPSDTKQQSSSSSDSSSVYAPKYADFLSRVNNFSVIESTLREGEQFANAFFDRETKIKIAKALDDFGVEYIELTSPAASEQSRQDCEAICKLGLKAKVSRAVDCQFFRKEGYSELQALNAPLHRLLCWLSLSRQVITNQTITTAITFIKIINRS